MLMVIFSLSIYINVKQVLNCKVDIADVDLSTTMKPRQTTFY